MLRSAYIEQDSTHEQDTRRRPCGRFQIKLDVAPRPGNGAGQDPHGKPDRQQHAIGRTPLRSPVIRERMNNEPKRRNGGVHDTCDPAKSGEKLAHVGKWVQKSYLSTA